MSKYGLVERADVFSSGSYRCDAGETAVMARELESIESYVTKKLYPELKAFDLVPIIGGIDAGADVWTWRMLDLKGYADLIGNGAGDLPSVDVDMGEFSRVIRSFGAQYGYSVPELRAFALAKARGSSISLDRARADAARVIIDRTHDRMVAFGDSRISGLTGFANDPNVTVLQATLFGSWATATPDQILADMLLMFQTVITQSQGVLRPDTLALPLAQYTIVTTRRLNTYNDTTIAEYFKRNTGVDVVDWWRLKATNSGGALTYDRAICYKRDVLVAGAIAPIVFEAQAPQQRNLRFQVPCEGRSGGAVWRLPVGGVYGDGI